MNQELISKPTDFFPCTSCSNKKTISFTGHLWIDALKH